MQEAAPLTRQPSRTGAIPSRREVDLDRFVPRRLTFAVVMAGVASVSATAAIRALSLRTGDVPARFTPLHAASVIAVTILGVIAAGAGCLALNRLVPRPAFTFRRAAPFLPVLTLIPAAAIWIGHAFAGAARGSTVVPLMLMNITVGAICIATLPRLGVSAESALENSD